MKRNGLFALQLSLRRKLAYRIEYNGQGQEEEVQTASEDANRRNSDDYSLAEARSSSSRAESHRSRISRVKDKG